MEFEGYNQDVIAAYMVLKMAYSTSVFYDYSIQKVAKKTGQCYNTTKKIIKLVIDNGLAHVDCKNNLVIYSKHFISRKKEESHYRRRKGYFFINSKKFKDVKKEYKRILLKDHLRKMQYASTKQPGINTLQDRKVRSEKKATELTTKLKLSSQRAGEIMGYSQVHALRVLKDFVEQEGGTIHPGQIRNWGTGTLKGDYLLMLKMLKYGLAVKVKECNAYTLGYMMELSLSKTSDWNNKIASIVHNNNSLMNCNDIINNFEKEYK